MSEIATTKLSSKGQVVIPEAIRERLGLHGLGCRRRDDDLRQQTDVSTMPNMRAVDDDEPSEEELAQASEQAPTGDW